MGNSTALVPLVQAPDYERCGPKMQAITENERRFVIAMVETGGSDPKLAAQMAGYGGTENSRSVAVHRLMHSEDVLAAIREETDKLLRFSALIGYKALEEIAQDRANPKRFNAAVELLNRAGLQVIQKFEHTIDDKRKTREIIADIKRMAKELGIDPALLLGKDVIDAEFTEVVKAPAEFNDLEDIFS